MCRRMLLQEVKAFTLNDPPNGLATPKSRREELGGRFVSSPENPRHFFDAGDEGAAEHADASKRKTAYRRRNACQASFQARMDWCVKFYREANHEPVAAVEGPLERVVRQGERNALNTAGSHDPDEDNLSCVCPVYREAGSYSGIGGSHMTPFTSRRRSAKMAMIYC